MFLVTTSKLADALGVSPSTIRAELSRRGHYMGHVPIRINGRVLWPHPSMVRSIDADAAMLAMRENADSIQDAAFRGQCKIDPLLADDLLRSAVGLAQAAGLATLDINYRELYDDEGRARLMEALRFDTSENPPLD